MPKHTKTPWAVTDDAIIVAPNGNHATELAQVWNAGGITPYANAAHIVKCVNGWDEQQAKINELVNALSMVSGRCTPEAQIVVDAALTRAKGE